jgi:hypothetical protein
LEIEPSDFPYSYSKYLIKYCYLGLDLNPLRNCHNSSLDNYNLKKQDCCFLLFDNENRDMCLINFLKILREENKSLVEQPIITRYDLKYNQAFAKLHSRQPTSIILFSYLRQQKSTGKFLFNDIQGLKYDLNFFHQ